MDQLKALEILELDGNASKKEIKEAYVRLSKIYHPEENPEKFKQIHEAYTYLLKNQRVSKREELKVEKEVQEIKEEQNPLDFDMVENAAIIKERELKNKLIKQAIDDFSGLLIKENKDKNKLFKAFFTKEAYASIINDTDFVYELADVLRQTDLKKTIYDYMIDFYRLRGEDPQYLNYGYQALYEVLDHKRGMKAKTKESVTLASIPFIIFMTIFREIRLVARAEDFVPVLVGIMALVFIFYGFYKLYLHLYESYSNLKAQTLTALAIIAFHIIVIIFDIYKYILVDSELGTAFAGGFILLSLLWLIVILIVYLFKKVKRNLSK